MVAVKGLYKGGDTVKIDASSLSFIHEPYEVDKRKAGFQTFMNYKGMLPADFDYRKELADYRDERHGRTH
jgi:hypothetical protein